MNTSNPEHCPECGAPKIEGLDCWNQLCLILAWESNDPELWALHFVIVAAYNLQHPAKFTEEAYAELQEVFIDYLENRIGIPEIRQRVSKSSNGKKRVEKPEAERIPVLRRWDQTIDSVCGPNTPEGAAQRVKNWVESIRKELAG